jgi:hypothetical protein
MKFILLVSIVAVLLGCDPIDDKLVINNNSDEPAFYAWSPRNKLNELYEEGLDKYNIQVAYTNYVREIPPNTKQVQILTGAGKAWERYIRDNCDEEKIHIYIFNIDTLEKYDWKTVIESNFYSKKMEFSIKDLEKLNWEIPLR